MDSNYIVFTLTCFDPLWVIFMFYIIVATVPTHYWVTAIFDQKA